MTCLLRGVVRRGDPDERTVVDFILAMPVTEDTLRACLAQVLLSRESDSPENR